MSYRSPATVLAVSRWGQRVFFLFPTFFVVFFLAVTTVFTAVLSVLFPAGASAPSETDQCDRSELGEPSA